MKPYIVSKNGCEYCEKQPIVLDIHLIKNDFRKKFEKVLYDWGIDDMKADFDENQLLIDDLMKCFD